MSISIGRLIVFEGPDGVGKTALANALLSHFNSIGIRSECLAFPGNEVGTLGHLVYDVHHHPEKYNIERIPAASLQLLHIAAHIDAIENRIRPLLLSGHDVILDRYWWSTWVYGVVDGANVRVIKAMIDVEKLAWGDVQPAWVFLIDREHSLRIAEAGDRWQQLRKTYHGLMQDEKINIPVVLIENEVSIEVALESVTKLLDKNEKLKGDEK